MSTRVNTAARELRPRWSATMTPCWGTGMIGAVEHFVDDDSAYLRWVADHPAGYVINADRSPSTALLMLHRADCHTITGVPAQGSTFTRDYSKVCGSREELEAFAADLGGSVKPCGICMAQRAGLRGQRPGRSRYLPLRNYLASRDGYEVRMSFAEIEELVGPLPDSARSHRAWWSNSSHVARAWRDVGWHLRSVNQAAEQVVFTRDSDSRPPFVGNDDGASRPTYVDAQVIAAIRAHERPSRFDQAKLLRLIDELNDNYGRGSIYAAHAVLRALLDHIPPLLSCTNFTAVANNYPWNRTDKAYMRRLLDFKLQADDAMHRQISARADLLSLHDLPPRAWVNRLLQECASASQEADLEALISNRESASLEFKQTLQWDVKLHRPNRELLKACVKTVCAFLNGAGGTLLIGVADWGEPTGLEDDLQGFANRPTVDGLELRFRDALVAGLDPEVSHLVTLSFPFVRGVQICWVDVKPAPVPIFLVGKGVPPEFYVRKGNTSRQLDVKRAHEYIREHWK
jgi:Putative DNA-binding domain